MYHYLFTNDLRISVLDESLKKAGHCFVTNTVPSSSVDKSANNNMMTLGFYFTLTETSNCAKAAQAGNTRAVVLNFIKKFQFPNMRTTSAFTNAKEDGIKLAPMRIIVKLLYTMNLLHGSLVAYLTKNEIKNFVFYNDNVAKKRNPDIGQLITEILEYRKTGILPDSISISESEHEWKHEDRQIREMLKVLQWSGCITEKDGNFVIDNDELSSRNKADVFDIITCDTFWEGTTIESYHEYMDMPDYVMDIDGKNENVQTESDDPEERNKRLFKYWMGLQVKPKGDSDAGNSYYESTINQYVADISNVELPMVPGKSVFYTTNIDDVEITIEGLEAAENKYTPQISAVRKYAEYLATLVPEEDCEEIFSHSLFGIHIKEKNTALSDDNPHICIGWSRMGDLSEIADKNELATLYDEYFEKNNRGRGQDIGQVWRFINDVKEGDYVIFAENSVFHIGRVESEYYFDRTDYENQNSDYRNTRKVRWLKKNISRSVLSSDLHNSLKTAMSIWSLNDYKSAVCDLLRGTYQKDEDREEAEEIMELNFKTGLPSSYKRNRILFGAPGTGKSFNLNKERKKLLGEDNEVDYERVTFHPDYSYANFVGTYKPTMIKSGEGKEITYEYVPGPFMRVLVKALKNAMSESPKPYLLIVEEINRANVAAVFGDVFQLLDRDKNNISEYSISTTNDMRVYLAEKLDVDENAVETIKIPDNMFIWATMNSADQGVFPMDTAFKRRWDFKYLGIDDAVETYSDKIVSKKYILGKGDFARRVGWNDLRVAINEVLSSESYNINEDKLLGPYFIAKSVLESDVDSDFTDVFKNKVLMYLFDDAVKHKKKTFFIECKDDEKGVRYSDICKLFDVKGVFIFPTEISKRFSDKPDEEKSEADN